MLHTIFQIIYSCAAFNWMEIPYKWERFFLICFFFSISIRHRIRQLKSECMTAKSVLWKDVSFLRRSEELEIFSTKRGRFGEELKTPRFTKDPHRRSDFLAAAEWDRIEPRRQGGTIPSLPVYYNNIECFWVKAGDVEYVKRVLNS